MGQIRGLIGVAVIALAFLCGCGHGNSATPAGWVVFASDRDGRWDVYAVHPDGTGLIRATARREEMPPLLASSPRADKLAIVNSAGTTVVDASGARTMRRGGDRYATPYVSEKGEVTLASGERTTVSPDGKHRAFLDARGRLWIRAKKDGRPHKVALAEQTSQLVWSPAGSLLAFTTLHARHAQLAVVNPDGSGLRVLTRSVDGEAVYPNSWTPDGERLLAVRGNDTGVGRALLDQVWSIGVDVRAALALTHAYPDGGENIRPVYFQGKLAAVAAPPAVQRTTRAGPRTILRTRYLVGEVRLNEAPTRVAVLPLAHNPQTPRPTFPFLVWTPKSERTFSWPIPACAAPEGLLFDGRVAAFDCNNSCCDSIDETLLVLHLGDPVPFEAAHGQGDGYRGGTFLRGYGLERGTIIYAKSRQERQRVLWSGMWRLGGQGPVRFGPLTGQIAGYSNGRVAVLGGRRISVLDKSGRLLYWVALSRTKTFGPQQDLYYPNPADEPQLLLEQHVGAVLQRRRLRAWNARTGRLLGSWLVPARAKLEALQGKRAVMIVGKTVRILDLTESKWRILRFPAFTIDPVGELTMGFLPDAAIRADLDGHTLVVSYNLSPRKAEPGRVVLMHLP
ncbi:MAG TPA: hypothetical protein VIL96_09590 [Gaiellaceae bacterium]|jgi:hypothetical protein